MNRLWETYISGLTYGTPARDILAMLGEPTSRDGRIYYYQAVDSDTCLILEEDAQGRLVTWKL